MTAPGNPPTRSGAVGQTGTTDTVRAPVRWPFAATRPRRVICGTRNGPLSAFSRASVLLDKVVCAEGLTLSRDQNQ